MKPLVHLAEMAIPAQKETTIGASAVRPVDDPGSPVSKHYPPPFEVTGTVFKVAADVSGKMIQDTEEEQKAMAKAHMARQ
jgi:hypothetical protein